MSMTLSGLAAINYATRHGLELRSGDDGRLVTAAEAAARAPETVWTMRLTAAQLLERALRRPPKASMTVRDFLRRGAQAITAARAIVAAPATKRLSIAITYVCDGMYRHNEPLSDRDVRELARDCVARAATVAAFDAAHRILVHEDGTRCVLIASFWPRNWPAMHAVNLVRPYHRSGRPVFRAGDHALARRAAERDQQDAA